MIIYVTSGSLAATQTFVREEIAELRRLGLPIHEFGLRGPRRFRPANGSRVHSFQLLRELLSFTSVIELARATRLLAREWAGCRRPRDMVSRLFSAARAFELCLMLRAAGGSTSARLHAHFLGRTLEVAAFTAAISKLDIRVGATAHAGDATNPGSPDRVGRHLVGVDFVACASSFVQQAVEGLTRAYPAAQRPTTYVVHCGIRPVVSTERPQRTPVSIVSIGRLVEKKGFDTAIRAARILDELGIEVTWQIVGDGPLLADLHRQAGELLDRGIISFRGHLAHDEALAILDQEADIFVLACRQAADGDTDGIPVALMEAMTRAIPVISSRVGGIPELVEDGVTGLLVAEDDPADLASAIRRYLGDWRFAARVSTAGKRQVDSEFNVTHEAAKMMRLLSMPLGR